MNRRNCVRPDLATRFKKGVSGNPKGRPKGKSKNVADSDPFNAVLGEIVVVKIDGKNRRVSIRELIVRTAAGKAVKGDAAMAKLLLTTAPAIAVDQQAVDWRAQMEGARERLRQKLRLASKELDAKKKPE